MIVRLFALITLLTALNFNVKAVTNLTKNIVLVDGNFVCADINNIDALIGKFGNQNKITLSKNIKISKEILFSNLIIAGKLLSRSGAFSEKSRIETIGDGSVKFNGVMFQDVQVGNLKHH